MNLSYLLSLSGRNREAEEVVERGLAHARRRGDRTWERALTTNLVSTYLTTGRWDDLERVIGEIPEEGRITSDPVQASTFLDLATIALFRGEPERVRELAAEYAAWPETAYAQAAGVRLWARTLLAQAEGRHDDALAESVAVLGNRTHAQNPVAVEITLQLGSESAIATESAAALATLVELAEAAPVDRPPSLEAQLELQRARLAALRAEDEPPYDAAVAALREIEDPFWIGTAVLEQAEWLTGRGRSGDAAPLVAEAREIFERLRVPPALERVGRIQTRMAAPPAAAPVP